jgi:xanthine/uracil permease
MLKISDNALQKTFNLFNGQVMTNLLKNRSFNTQTKQVFSLVNSLLIQTVSTLSQIRMLEESKLAVDSRYKVTFKDKERDT